MEEVKECRPCGGQAMRITVACPKHIFVKASYSILHAILYFRCITKNTGKKININYLIFIFLRRLSFISPCLAGQVSWLL